MKNVFVIGSTNQDIVISLDNIPKVGETLFGNNINYFQGGKGANQAIACNNTGAKTQFYSAIGNDVFGESLKNELQSYNLNCNFTITDNSTGIATINVDKNGNNNIVVVSGANNDFDVNSVNFNSENGDILLIQNELHKSQLGKILTFGKNNGLINILNNAPAVCILDYVDKINYLIVNEFEFNKSFNIDINFDTLNIEECKANVMLIAKKHGLNLILTLGNKGSISFIEGNVYHIDAINVKVSDTTGAGDCFSGTFAGYLSQGLSIFDILKYSNRAAGLSTEKLGATSSYPSKDLILS